MHPLSLSTHLPAHGLKDIITMAPDSRTNSFNPLGYCPVVLVDNGIVAKDCSFVVIIKMMTVILFSLRLHDGSKENEFKRRSHLPMSR